MTRLPSTSRPGDDSAGWWDYADAVVEAVDDREHVVVGHSMAVSRPVVCERRPADLLVLVAAMIPAAGESFNDFWRNTEYEEPGYEDVFYHDVTPELAAEAHERKRAQADKVLAEPWPLEQWPDVPTNYLLCRGDRLIPADWARGLARERLGIEAGRDRRRALHRAQQAR
jgi:hypothetical protein